MFDLVKRFRGARRAGAGRRPRRDRAQPGLEALEDRTVPTIAFTPHFSGTTEYAPPKTTIAQEHAGSLSSPSVVFIFSGSYWRTDQGKIDRQTLTGSMQSILSSPYLSALTQYGSDGKASYFGSWQDDSTPTLTGNTPTSSDLKSYVQAEVKSHSASAPKGSNVIYVVVNDPKDSVKSSSTYGYNWTDGSTLHAAYVGATTLSGGALDKDGFTWIFSHELAEAMVPAVHVTDPGGLGLGYQIADGEPENFGNGYTYRYASGNLVQAYWSQRDGAFIVPDGNSEKFTLSWATNSFNNTYNLQVNGDQLGTNFNDDITIDRSPNTSGTRVTMNGQSASFALGAIKSLNVNTGGGFNTVRVQGVESGETVNVDSFGSSFDSVIVGSNGSLAGIQGVVNVSNTSGRTWLQIDDSNDKPRAITITDHSVAFQGLATINYTPYGGPSSGPVHGVMGLEIDDSWGANQINALSVPGSVPVTIEGNPLDNLFGPAAGKVSLNRQGFRGR